MASIFVKRGMLWLGWIERDSDGNIFHPQINLQLKDTKQNRKIAKELKKQKEAEILVSPTPYIKKIKLEEAKRIFLNKKKSKSQNTLSIYTYALTKLNYSTMTCVGDINRGDIRKIVERLRNEGKSEQTIKTYLKHIKIFFQYCIEEKWLNENPVEIIKVDSNNVVKIITDDELEKIFNHFKGRNVKHYNFLRVLNTTGLRISEAVGLKWEAVDFGKRTILIRNTKGRRVEEIPLNDEAVSVNKNETNIYFI